MKRLAFVAAVLLLASCGGSVKVPVTVTNPSDFDRNEILGLDLSAMAAGHPEITAENAVICDSAGKVLVCDVQAGPDSVARLYFEASVPASGKSAYFVKAGSRKAAEPQVMTRPVPERCDDAAFENCQVAFRAYGKGLEWQTISPGIDLWVKYGGKLVMDGWYAGEVKQEGYYHTDRGEGKDCYKVGPTLGCGGSAPLVADTLAKPDHNFVSNVKVLDGALEQSFTLTYDVWKIGDRSVSLSKTITVPATGNFCRVDDVYSGDFDSLDVACGVAVHDVEILKSGFDFVSVWEKPSDSKTPDADGMIGTAVYMPGCDSILLATVAGQALLVKRIVPGQKVTYYMGAGWSKGNVKDAAAWDEAVRRLRESVSRPLLLDY